MDFVNSEHVINNMNHCCQCKLPLFAPRVCFTSALKVFCLPICLLASLIKYRIIMLWFSNTDYRSIEWGLHWDHRTHFGCDIRLIWTQSYCINPMHQRDLDSSLPCTESWLGYIFAVCDSTCHALSLVEAVFIHSVSVFVNNSNDWFGYTVSDSRVTCSAWKPLLHGLNFLVKWIMMQKMGFSCAKSSIISLTKSTSVSVTFQL